MQMNAIADAGWVVLGMRPALVLRRGALVHRGPPSQCRGPRQESGRPQDGISAIEEMARKVQALHRLTDFETGVTVNVGLIKGGSSVNTVAPHCSAEVDVRFKTMADREATWVKIREILETVHL